MVLNKPQAKMDLYWWRPFQNHNIVPRWEFSTVLLLDSLALMGHQLPEIHCIALYPRHFICSLCTSEDKNVPTCLGTVVLHRYRVGRQVWHVIPYGLHSCKTAKSTVQGHNRVTHWFSISLKRFVLWPIVREIAICQAWWVHSE